MESIGVNPDRLRIRVMSGSEGNVYAQEVNSFVGRIKELGPLGGESDKASLEEINAGIAKMVNQIPYIKVMTNEKLAKRQEVPDDSIEYFTSAEIDDLLNKKMSYYIEPEKCQACMSCTRRCPVGAVISAKGQVHIIDQDKCIRCGNCISGCPDRFAAIKQFGAGEAVPPPLPEDQRAVVRKAKENA